ILTLRSLAPLLGRNVMPMSARGTNGNWASPSGREYGRSYLRADIILMSLERLAQVIAPLREEDDHAQSAKHIGSKIGPGPMEQGEVDRRQAAIAAQTCLVDPFKAQGRCGGRARQCPAAKDRTYRQV